VATQAAPLLPAIQNDRYFTLKIRAGLVELVFDADRGDWSASRACHFALSRNPQL